MRGPSLFYAAFYAGMINFHRMGEHCSPALPYQLTPKYTPAPLAGLPCRPLQAKGKAYAKILSLFQNFIVGASIARPPLPCPLAQKIFPRTVAGLPCRPLQAIGKARVKILLLFQNFIVGASIARPPLPYPLAQKTFPRTVAGLQCRPLQAKGKAYAKILLLFLNSTVLLHKNPGAAFRLANSRGSAGVFYNIAFTLLFSGRPACQIHAGTSWRSNRA